MRLDARKNKVLNQILYGDIDSLVTQQACDHLQLNPTVDQLDDEQRIRVGAAMAVANWLENLDDIADQGFLYVGLRTLVKGLMEK